MDILKYKKVDNIISVISDSTELQIHVDRLTQKYRAQTVEMTIAAVLEDIEKNLSQNFDEFEIPHDIIVETVTKMIPAVSAIVRKTMR